MSYQSRADVDAQYEAALAHALSSVAPSLAVMTQLEGAAAALASTTEGAKRVSADIDTADRAHAFERAAVLHQGLTKGRAHAAAGIEIRGLLADAAPAAARSVPVGMRDWRADQPIWANVDTMAVAMRATRLPALLIAAGNKAYREVFAREWRAMFSNPDGTEANVDSDQTGWNWRREVTGRADAALKGAAAVRVGDLRAGMVVFTGEKVKVVAGVSLGLPMRLAGPGGTVRQVAGVHVTYARGGSDGPLAADKEWVRLVALEN